MKKIILALVVTTALVGTAISPLRAADSMTDAQKRELFRKGAKLWPLYCNTCHNARPGGEKAAYEWDQVLMHMRTLGNLPPEDADALLVFLKGSH